MVRPKMLVLFIYFGIFYIIVLATGSGECTQTHLASQTVTPFNNIITSYFIHQRQIFYINVLIINIKGSRCLGIETVNTKIPLYTCLSIYLSIFHNVRHPKFAKSFTESYTLSSELCFSR